MRVVVAGSRTIENYIAVCKAIHDSPFVISTLLSGGARGIDSLGEKWARFRCVPIERYPVTNDDWRRKGSRAGPERNYHMASKAEALILVWDGVSKGSLNMKQAAEFYRLPIFEVILHQKKPATQQEVPGRPVSP